MQLISYDVKLKISSNLEHEEEYGKPTIRNLIQRRAENIMPLMAIAFDFRISPLVEACSEVLSEQVHFQLELLIA
jgi:hypothetical protein